MTYSTMNQPLSRCRVDELLDCATRYREVDENTPALDDNERDIIRAMRELLLYKGRYESDDGYTTHDEREDKAAYATEPTPESLR